MLLYLVIVMLLYLVVVTCMGLDILVVFVYSQSFECLPKKEFLTYSKNATVTSSGLHVYRNLGSFIIISINICDLIKPSDFD